MPSRRKERQELILSLVREGKTTPQEVQKALQRMGLSISRGTLYRDFHSLGLPLRPRGRPKKELPKEVVVRLKPGVRVVILVEAEAGDGGEGDLVREG